MAIAYVQSGYVYVPASTSSAAVTISASGAGNLIVVCITGEPNAEAVSGIADNVGNVYAEVPNSYVLAPYGTGETTEIWFAQNATAGATTVTVSWSVSNAQKQVGVVEFSGVSASYTPSGATTSGNTAAAVSPAQTPTVANSILVALAVPRSVGIAATGSWTGTTAWANVVYYANPALSAQQCAYTPATAQQFIASGALFTPLSVTPTRTVFGAGGFTSQA